MKINPKSILLKTASYGDNYLSSNSFMQSGHNGPYQDNETPVRNNAHWAMIFLKSFEITGLEKYLDNAKICISFLREHIKNKKVFICREKTKKDCVNGLIGQAWAIEPFIEIQKYENSVELLQIASDLVNLHLFDEERGLWKISDESGNPTVLDYTFNHQLWFASICSEINDQKIQHKVKRFLSNINKNLVVHNNGRIGQSIYINFFESDLKHYAKKLLRPQDIYYMKLKEVGYHAFNTFGFIRLYNNYSSNEFWSSKKFQSILLYLNSTEYKEMIFKSKYGFPYNPPGFEVYATYLNFSKICSLDESFVKQLWEHQIELCWNAQKGVLSEGSFDENTNIARAYECFRCIK